MKNYRLYLIRHGITKGNMEGIYMGAKTDFPLCEQGRSHLRQLQQQFSYPQADTVFSSPMKRAVETAELLFGQAANKLILEDLRENDFGEFEGRKINELVHDQAFRLWMDPAQPFTPKGGESAECFHLRCKEMLFKMLEYMMKAHIEQAACVTHGGVIMSMLTQCALPQRSPEQWMADSGCGYVVQCSTQMWMRDRLVEATDVLPYGYLDE